MAAAEDWLDISESTEPETATLPTLVDLPTDLVARVALIEQCWNRLTLPQRTFLTALRENRFNARKTARKLEGVRGCSLGAHKKSLSDPDYVTVFHLWLGSASQEALDRDRLLARQDDIVEEALTPKPVLYQGEHTGFEEVELGTAAKANEVLLRAAGVLKDKDIEVNVGIVGPAFTIQVVQPSGEVIDVTPKRVEVALPEPEATDADWTE